YTRSENYGRIRIFTQGEFQAADADGAFSFQDIVVLPFAPSDIEGVIAGVITGAIQGELGHLAIRSARRGTPNAYVKDAATVFAPWDGKLVHLVLNASDYQVTETTL